MKTDHYPIITFHFCYLTYHGKMTAKELKKLPYFSERYFYWFKNQWRHLENYEVLTMDKDGKPATISVTFTGLKARKVNASTRLFSTYEGDAKAISENRWYGQKNGPCLWDGVNPVYHPADMTYNNPEWIKNRFEKDYPQLYRKFMNRLKKQTINAIFLL